MEAAIDVLLVTRQKLDRLTVKKTAKFEDQRFSVDHRATFPKTPSASSPLPTAIAGVDSQSSAELL
jgi:hypothetical protein